MTRLIDADRVLSHRRFNSSFWLEIEAMIKDAPTIDAVEVVRCKDCKHLYKDGECPLRTWFTHTEDDFCSYGERR